ncbi:imelysin family protein [Nannocystis punicea]|uniref:Imelysin family protein n=1 Tax=Nannocystis punicea TaxID=2995304 RepID=A0ABY7GSF8_9BACT|nr:imelysin family protein [Nannocystis poenicansa]WAS89895.1 imelysin family protein [Nannocystis poenicansa]
MLFGAGAGTLVGLACGGGGDDSRPAVLEHVAREVAVPAFTALHDRAEEMVATMDFLCAAPDPGALATAQTAWSAERDAWSRVLPFGFGPLPAELNALDFWPVRIDTIEDAVAGAPEAADAAYLGTLGVSAKGMPALEYLLWGETSGEALTALQAPEGARRCAYARALAVDIAARTDALATAWSGGYADELASAGSGSTVYGSLKAGLDEVVNKSIDACLTMVKGKLDNPLGNLTGAAEDPSLMESRFSGRTRADLQASLAGVWAVYHGADPDAPAAGISVLVRELDPSLDDRVRAQYARAVEVLAAVPEPMTSALLADRTAVQLARDELDTFRRLLKLDVASTLGVTLALSDNDGD